MSWQKVKVHESPNIPWQHAPKPKWHRINGILSNATRVVLCCKPEPVHSNPTYWLLTGLQTKSNPSRSFYGRPKGSCPFQRNHGNKSTGTCQFELAPLATCPPRCTHEVRAPTPYEAPGGCWTCRLAGTKPAPTSEAERLGDINITNVNPNIVYTNLHC